MDRYTLVVSAISLLGVIQRLLREDVKWFKTVQAPWRGLLVAGIGMVATPTLDALLNGANWKTFLLTGVASVIPTVLSVLVGMTADKQPTSTAKPPPPPVPPSPFVGLMLVLAFAPWFTGCLSSSFEEARLAGVRSRAMVASATNWGTPAQQLSAAKAAEIAAAPSEYCASLDNGQLWFRAIGTGLSLAAGPTVVPAFALPEDNAETKRAFLVAAGLAGVAGGVLLLIGDGKATTWVRDCAEQKAVQR